MKTYYITRTNRFLGILVVAALLIACLAGFAACKETPPQEVDFYLPDGTPALAVANILASHADFSETKTNFHIVTASTIATSLSSSGLDGDIAIMPTVVAANLFSKGQKLKILSANVFGNLFLMGVNTTATSVEDLLGKVVKVTVGTTMDMLKFFLREATIEWNEGSEASDNAVTISSASDGSEIIASLKSAQTTEVLGVLGEPQVTKAKQLVGAGLLTVLDFQEQWKDETGFNGYPQASLVATEEFCKNNADYIEKLLTALEGNATYLQQNYSTLPTLFATYESSLANMTFTQETIDNCNIRLERASLEATRSSIRTYIGTITHKFAIGESNLIFYGV